MDLHQPHQDRALQELVQKTVVPGQFSYVYQRVQQYESFARVQGHAFEVWGVWDEQNQLLGSTQITFDRVYWNGTSTEIAYSGDTRIAPEARGRRLADALIQHACSINVPILGAVMGSNTLVLEKKLKDWKNLGVDFQIVGELKAILYRASRAKKRAPNVRVATLEDLPAMHSLWQKEQSRRNLGRDYATLDEFQKSYETISGISLSETWIVEGIDQSIIGFFSLWDQSRIRKIRVHRLNGILGVFTKWIRPWMAIPQPGEELKIAYAFQVCVQNDHVEREQALASLIETGRVRSKELGFLLFTMGMDARDPLLSVAKKGALTVNSVQIIAANAQPDGRPFHLEVGLG